MNQRKWHEPRIVCVTLAAWAALRSRRLTRVLPCTGWSKPQVVLQRQCPFVCEQLLATLPSFSVFVIGLQTFAKFAVLKLEVGASHQQAACHRCDHRLSWHTH
jgi:hypothetical protein